TDAIAVHMQTTCRLPAQFSDTRNQLSPYDLSLGYKHLGNVAVETHLAYIFVATKRGDTTGSGLTLSQIRNDSIRRGRSGTEAPAWIRLPLVLLVSSIWISACANADEIKIAYLREPDSKSRLSLVQIPASDDGLAGAQLAISDNNTTGKFLNQQFALEDAKIRQHDDPVTAAIALSERGVALIVADLSADALLRVAGAGRHILFLNVGATDDGLREEDCRSNVIHVAPTRSMLADGLAQYLIWKQWRRWFLFVGSHDEDRLYADAIRRAGRRFGARIVQEKVFEDTGGARRTDSGIAQIQRQWPVLTRGVPAYDLLIAADESEVFASSLPYRSWDPRPVAGSSGLVPTTWDASHDQWGAVQL